MRRPFRTAAEYARTILSRWARNPRQETRQQPSAQSDKPDEWWGAYATAPVAVMKRSRNICPHELLGGGAGSAAAGIARLRPMWSGRFRVRGFHCFAGIPPGCARALCFQQDQAEFVDSPVVDSSACVSIARYTKHNWSVRLRSLASKKRDRVRCPAQRANLPQPVTAHRPSSRCAELKHEADGAETLRRIKTVLSDGVGCLGFEVAYCWR